MFGSIPQYFEWLAELSPLYVEHIFRSERWTEIKCSLSFVGVYSELLYASSSERRK
jgi:hypothetical protein